MNTTERNDKMDICRRSFLATLSVATAGLLIRPDSTLAQEKEMIQRIGTQASVEGPAEWFTGMVRIDPLFDAKAPSRVGGASVTFEPGARTAWHTHPFGQHLIITSGVGWVQQEGEQVQEVRPGDVVWFPPGVKHWHGASPKNAMTHIAIHEYRDGSPVDWLEHVSDEQYRK